MRLFLFVRALLRHAERQAAMLRLGFNLKESPTWGFFFMHCSKNYARQAKRVVSNVKKESKKTPSLYTIPPRCKTNSYAARKLQSKKISIMRQTFYTTLNMLKDRNRPSSEIRKRFS